MNNKGFSMVEAIIVIMILSVLGVGAAMSISMVDNSNAKACANSIRDTIADAKILAMSKGNNKARVHIYKDAKGRLRTQQEIKGVSGWEPYQEENDIGKRRVDISYIKKGETAENPVTDGGAGLYISFDRSSGAFTVIADGADPGKNTIIPEVIFVRGGNRIYRLLLHELTGKVEIVE